MKYCRWNVLLTAEDVHLIGHYTCVVDVVYNWVNGVHKGWWDIVLRMCEAACFLTMPMKYVSSLVLSTRACIYFFIYVNRQALQTWRIIQCCLWLILSCVTFVLLLLLFFLALTAHPLYFVWPHWINSISTIWSQVHLRQYNKLMYLHLL